MGEFGSIWADSNWQIFAVPFISTVICCLYFRWVLQQGRRHATRFITDQNNGSETTTDTAHQSSEAANRHLSLAAFSMVLGFWFSYTTLRGFPTTTPLLLDGYLPWIIAVSGVFGMLLDFFKVSTNARNSFYLLYAMLLSFGMGVLINGPVMPTYMIIRYAVFSGIGFLIFSRMDEDHDLPHTAPIAALACLLGVLAISLIYTSRYSLFSFSLIGAVCGFLAVSMQKPHLPWSSTAILSVGSGIIGLMAILGLPRVSYLLPPLSLSMLCFAVPLIIRKFGTRSWKAQLALQVTLSIPLIVASGLLTYDHM